MLQLQLHLHKIANDYFSVQSVQSFSHVQFFATPWTAAPQAFCPSPTPRVYSNSYPSCRWCHLTISSSVIPFSSHLQSFPASGSFQMNHLFTPGGQSIRVSASASVLPMNIQDWLFFFFFRMDWLALLAFQKTQESSSTPQLEASIHWFSAFYIVQLSHPYMTTGKAIALLRRNFVGKVMSLLLNMLSRLVTAFLPRSKHLLISWPHSPSEVILEPKK